MEYLERCLQESEAVLRGSAAAAERLWLLLREPVECQTVFPAAVAEGILGRGGQEEPSAIDGDHLLTLISGVVRAANHPEEARTMLESLRRLLEPLFLLENAMHAADEAIAGQHDSMKTLVVAWQARGWRAGLWDGAAAFPDVPFEADTESPRERIPPNMDAWRIPLDDSVLGRWSFQWPCILSTMRSMSFVDRWGPRYTVESLSDPEACAGKTITLRGRNFGPSGRVVFPLPEPDDPLFDASDPGITLGVEPKRWTDTEIDVVVPKWATTGEISLHAFTHDESKCMKVDVHRLGNAILFQGGLASVFKVFLNGQELDPNSRRPPNLKPKDVATVIWLATSGPNVRVSVRLETTSGVVLWRSDGLPGGLSSVAMPVPEPNPARPTNAVLVVSATSPCGSTRPKRFPVVLSVPPVVTIEFIEVTQGVQENQTDVLAGRGMPTVAEKDTAVRVHIRCDRGGWNNDLLQNVTGELTIGPRNVGLMPKNAGRVAIAGVSRPEYTDQTLNFTIPAAWATPGEHTLTVKVVCEDPSGRIERLETIRWTWIAKWPLRVRCLWLAIGGERMIQEMLDFARQALDFLPTPLTDIGIAAPVWFSHNYDLTTDDGWDALLGAMPLS